MEEILKFLVVMGIIGFMIYRQATKARKAAEETQAQAPSYDPEEYEGWEEEEETIRDLYPQEASTRQSHASRRTTSARPQTVRKVPEDVATEETENIDYGIHSAEEARRAIVWSEILKRKYD
ncbi:MAG: hypothetical protein LIP08_01585 [Bacteroides sp.]|nr:hypothetical protein [Bacteroides sp.]